MLSMGRRESPVRKSPSRRERSPGRGRTSNEKEISGRSRSSRRSRSRSPAFNSPKKERRRSPSPMARSPGRHKSSGRTRSSPPVSPIKEKLPPRTSSPKRVKPTPSESRPAEKKMSVRASSPINTRSRSPESRSPSPRAKRLNRVKSEQDVGKGSDREREKDRSRNGELIANKEKVSEKEKIRTSSLRNASARSPESRSPSPRTKRLNRAKAERDSEKESRQECEKDHRRNGESAAYKEKDSGKDTRTSSLRNARSSRSPSSRSPSPRTKRLNRAKAERDAEKGSNREREKDCAAYKEKSEKDTQTSVLINARSRSPESRAPSPRTKRLNKAKAARDAEKGSIQEHEKDRSRNGQLAAYKEKDSDKDIRTSSVRNAMFRSPESRSPSPRSKRLKRVKTDRDAEKGGYREPEKFNSRKGETVAYKEKDTDNVMPGDKRDRRPGRDDVDRNSSRSRHRRSTSPSNHHHRRQHRSRSPSAAGSRGRDEMKSSRDDEHWNGDDDSIAKMNSATDQLEAKEKQKPSFELSGKLADETNRVKGVTLLFNEPPDARKPDVRWRLYVFKGGDVLNEPLYVHRQSCYLFGRERKVAEIPTDHPSCSKQHAVLQFRQVEQENPDGTTSKKVRPYLMDLGSTNGTFINDEKMEAQRYYELFEKDTIKFGNSSREYVLLHENSTG